jgi:ubiquinone/menaquinone biosynthesis C-methylase UbiE
VPNGLLIDYGCGSLVFTSSVYADHADRIDFFDRSLGMLARGVKRLPNGQFLQGDALDPPFESEMFAGAMSWGMLHIFGSASPYLEKLSTLLQPAAPVSISMLVLGDRRIGNAMLNQLYKTGEAAKPELAVTVLAAFQNYFHLKHSRQVGNMLFLRGNKISTNR